MNCLNFFGRLFKAVRIVAFVCLGAWFSWPGAWAQDASHVLDSLTTRLYVSRGVERLEVLNALPEYVIRDHPDLALKYVKEAHVLALSLEDAHGLGDVWFNYGRYFHDMGKMDSAIHFFHLCREVRAGLPDVGDGMGQVLNGLGAAHDGNSRGDSALKYYYQAEDYAEQEKDKQLLSSIYGNIGANLIDQRKYEQAVLSLKKGLALDLEGNDMLAAATTMSNIGVAYQKTSMLDSALHFNQKALAIRQKSGNMMDVARSLNNLGLVYQQMKLRQEAADNFLESLTIKRSVGNTYEVARTSSNLGLLYNEMGRYKDALLYLHEARRITDTLLSAPVRMKAMFGLSTAYAGLGNFEEAFTYLQLADSIQLVLSNNERDEKVEQLMAQYKSAEKEKQIITLRQEQAQAALEAAEMSQREYLLISGLVILFLIGLTILFGFLVISNRNRKLSSLNRTLEERNEEIAGKTAEIKEQAAVLASQNALILENNANLELVVEERTANLKRSHAELDMFLYQSSHAMRGPLMRIKGLVEILKEENFTDDNRILFEKVEYTIRGKDRMLFKLMDAAEIHRHVLRPSLVDVRNVTRDMVEYINQSMTYPPCELRSDLPDHPLPMADHFLFATVLRNLIENALHFRFPGRQHVVELQVEQEDGKVKIRVRDNGLGIPADQMGQLGNMFHRATPKSAGMGLGLYLVRLSLERLDGTMHVDSVEGQFTEIRVEFPLAARGILLQMSEATRR